MTGLFSAINLAVKKDLNPEQGKKAFLSVFLPLFQTSQSLAHRKIQEQGATRHNVECFNSLTDEIAKVFPKPLSLLGKTHHTLKSPACSCVLRSKENFACVRVFYFGSRRKTGDVNVTAIWRERTDN